MEDVENRSYLLSGGIWTELNKRKSFARFAAIKSILIQHSTRILYNQSRGEMLELVNKKINYKEYLIKRQDTEFTDQLNKSIMSVESEINSLLSFVLAFDNMASFLEKETAAAVEQWYTTNRKNLILNQLLDSETERVNAWRNTAFKLHDDLLIINTIQPTTQMLKKELDISQLVDRNNSTTKVLPLESKKPTKWVFDLKELDSNRITNETTFPEPVPVLTINGSTFAVENELSIITGLPKAGKSAIITAMIAAPFASGRDIDTLSITAPSVKGRNVIYIDTEMSKGSTQKLHNQVLRMLDVNKTPVNLRFWNWKHYRPEDRVRALMATFDLIPDLHLIFIDGIADFLLSVNDEVKANELLEILGEQAEEKNCSIVTVIHENFGNGQARGHIGSSLGRKCAGTISIKKDRSKGITSIECKTLRHAPDFEPVFCQWDIDAKRLKLVDVSIAKALSKENTKTPEELEAEEKEQAYKILKQSFGPDATLSKKELINRVTRYYDPNKGIVSEKTATRFIKDAFDFALLTEHQKVYSLVSDVPF